MRKIIAAAIVTLILACLCPPLAAQSGQPTFLFLLEGKGVPTGTIHVFSVNTSTGALTETPGSPFNAGLIPQSLAVDPTGRFLYVANEQSDDITAFAIDPASGTLASLPGSPYAIGSQPAAIGVDPTGRFLYVTGTSGQAQSLFEFTIDGNTGILTAAPGSPQAGLFATSIAFDPIGSYAYLSTGSPAPGMSSPILACAINFATGMLTPVGGGQPRAGGSSAATVSGGGNLLYSVDSVTSGLDAFSVGTGGVSLTEASGSPYAVPNIPYSLVVHPTGNFLYVVNENQSYQTNYTPSQYNGDISAFTISPGSGALAPVVGSPFAAGINPLSIVIDPTGRFAYTTSTIYTFGYTGFARIMSFSIDPFSGSLTPLPGTTWTDSAQSHGSHLAISPSALLATNPAPMVTSLLPPSTFATATAFTLQVNGANFVLGSTVYYGGLARVTTFVSPTQLNAGILASDISDGGTAVVFVFNPLPGGGASTSIEFPVFNPVPIITSLTPSSVTAGVSGFSFAVIGSNFVTSSVINFNGSPLITSYSGPTVVTTAIPVALIQAPGTASITVTNPPNGLPGGGTSNAATMTILPPNTQPVVTNISPASATAGGPGFTLTVNGSGFVQGAQVTFNLNNVPTIFVNAGQLTAAIPASAIAVVGNPYVIVNNPDGFASAKLNFLVTNPLPTGGSVSPGSNALTLNVAGAGFLGGATGSTVFVNGSPRVTTFFSSTLLQATLLPSDLAQGGTLVITVMNPPPGGGTSAAIHFAVADYSLTPPTSTQSVTAGQTAKIALTVSSVGGTFSYPVMISASPLPANAIASFEPSPTITPGAAPQTVTLSIATTAHTATSAIRYPRGFDPAVLILCLVGVVFALMVLRRGGFEGYVPWLAQQAFWALFLLAVVGLVACGVTGAGTGPGTNATAPEVTLSPTSLTFGNQTVNTAGVAQSVTLTNSGTASLSLTTIVASAEYSESNGCGITVTAGGNCTIYVTFTPATTGSKPGTLAITDNASGSPHVVNLTGSATTDNAATGTPAGNYTITVTATSGGVSHSANVALTVM